MPTQIGDIVEGWLLREDRSRAQLARRARIAPETLARIVKGQQIAGPRVLKKLELAMGLAPGTLEAAKAQGALPLDNGAHVRKED